MTENEIEEAVEEVMTEIRAHDAFDPKHASKADSREFIKGIIEMLKLELEGLGGEDSGDDDDEE